MRYLIQPNILLTPNAQERKSKFNINDNDIYFTVNNYDLKEKLDDGSYKLRKKVDGKDVIVYCKWQNSDSTWLVTFCIKSSK